MIVVFATTIVNVQGKNVEAATVGAGCAAPLKNLPIAEA